MKKHLFPILILFTSIIALTSCAKNPTNNPPITIATVGLSSPTPTTLTQEYTSTPTATQLFTATPTTQVMVNVLPTATEGPTPTPQPSPTPTPSANTPTPTPAGNATACIDKAAFDQDVTISDNTPIQQNTTFIKTWRIQNAGTCAWGAGYLLVSTGGNDLNGPLSNPLPAAAPGDFIDVSVTLKSPGAGGLYTGYWEFQNPSGQRFGVNSNGLDLIWVKISVNYFLPAGTPSPTPAPTTDCTVERNADYESQILQLVNQARETFKVPDLVLNDKLSAAAFAHSQDMACHNYVDHTGSDGSTWYTRIKVQGYPYTYASENIYVGNPAFGGDAQGAFTWWMNSKIHHDNILNPKVTQIGIGYAFYANSDYGGYYTIDFAHP